MYPELCSISEPLCKLAKNVQSITRPGNLMDDYDSYSAKVVNFIYEFLSNKRPVKDILIDIDNLTRIHTFTIKSSLELIFFVSLLSLFYIVVFSPSLIAIPKLRKYFQFLTFDSWLLYIVGFLLIITNEILYYGELTEMKCYLTDICFSMGFVFTYAPIIQQLISNIPMPTEFTKWVVKPNFI